jgi:hypothetical protein
MKPFTIWSFFCAQAANIAATHAKKKNFFIILSILKSRCKGTTKIAHTQEKSPKIHESAE